MSCRVYVYQVIKLTRKVLCLFTFMFAESMNKPIVKQNFVHQVG